MATESGLETVGLNAGQPAEPVVMVAELVDADLADAQRSRASSGREWADVRAELQDDPHSFSFFQAVRLLERLMPDRLLVGGYDDPAREIVRFRVSPQLAFPASEIQDLELSDDGPARMQVNFMGLVGPTGVLPHPYTQLVADRIRNRDHALADFLDLFHHRSISLFYQAWRKYRFTVAREDDARDRLADHLLDLIGLGLSGYRNLLPFPDEALLFRSGLLLPQPRGAAALQQLLVDFFGVPAEVEQFIGAWYALARSDLCEIGEDDDDSNQLGFGAVAGDEIWDQQSRVRVRIGPLTRAQYDSFLPGGNGHAALAALLRFYSHDQFDFDVQLILARNDVPGLRLGETEAGPWQLGWTTWLCATSPAGDADQTVITLHNGAAS